MHSFAFVHQEVGLILVCLSFFFLASKIQEDVRNAGDSHDSDVEIVFEQQPTPEQADLAQKLMLPPTFFTYKNKPGYVSDDSDGKSLLPF